MKRVKLLKRGATCFLIAFSASIFMGGKVDDANTPNAELTDTIVQDSKRANTRTMSMMNEVVPSTTQYLAKLSVVACAVESSQQEEVETSSEKVEVEETTISTTETVERKYFDIPLSNEQQDFIYNKSKEYGIPFHISMGVFEQESTFNVNCKSGPNSNGTYDYGIGQINSCHFNYIDKSRIMEFEYNVDETLKMLKAHREIWKDKFDGEDLERAMINSYNMGQYGFKRNGCPLYRKHSNKIIGYSEKYK